MDIYEMALRALVGDGPALTLDQLDELHLRMDGDPRDGLMGAIAEYLTERSPDIFDAWY